MGGKQQGDYYAEQANRKKSSELKHFFFSRNNYQGLDIVVSISEQVQSILACINF